MRECHLPSSWTTDSGLESDSFEFFSLRFICSKICWFVQLAWVFSLRFTCSTNMSNQTSRLRVTARKLSSKIKVFFFNALFFLRASVSSLLNRVYGWTISQKPAPKIKWKWKKNVHFGRPGCNSTPYLVMFRNQLSVYHSCGNSYKSIFI